MKTVLIVDDSSTILMSMEQILSKHGLCVEKAVDGSDAAARIDAGLKPDLIITDINMPKMNGLELIKEVKKKPQCRFTPILVLTTEYDESKRTEAKSSGATGWLVKPVKSQELVDVLKKVLPGSVC